MAHADSTVTVDTTATQRKNDYFRADISVTRSLFLVFCFVVFLGCDRQAARKRVLDAVNPQELLVDNGRAAALKTTNGYAVIVPFKPNPTETSYQVFFSESGNFSNEYSVITQGTTKATLQLDIRGTTVWLDFGGEETTSVRLDFGDVGTGLALLPNTNFTRVDATQLTFKFGKSLKAEDLQKSIGVK